VQTVPIKTNHTATSAIMFLCCAMLASCSSSQNTFFAERDALINQGYKLEKLDKCRPAKKDTPAMPITLSNGSKLVCYTLVPTQAGAAAASPPAADDSQTALSNPTAATTTPAKTPGTIPATTPALPADPPADTSGIIWNFSNF
jgi:hypothetical protein